MTFARFRVSTRPLVLALALSGSSAFAQVAPNKLPTGGQVAAGQASVNQNGNTLSINQTTNKLVMNWSSFDVGSDATVSFYQPGANSIALNRIASGQPSQILGNLTANGAVWILNPSGVIFGQNAQVNVGGLVASTLSLSDADFLAGKTAFTHGAGTGSISNLGNLTARNGVVALIAPQVKNSGTISTPGGSTVLSAGDAVSLDFVGDGLVNVKVDRPVFNALVQNSGYVSADGGQVIFSARGANAALDSVINNTGIVESHGLVARGGRILLEGDASTDAIHNSGTLDVSSTAGKGGNLTVSAHSIALDHSAKLKADGATGGGSIRVGGGLHGTDTTVANASNVSADKTVSVSADATQNGDGGEVVFWSQDATSFGGKISTRGGALGGNGGNIEVSSHDQLSYSGVADALAPNGLTGNLLLDPASITISGGGTGSGSITGTTVYEKDLEAQSANVLLQTTGTATINDLLLNGGDGAISMQNNISFRLEAGTGTTTSANGSITFTNASNTLEVFGTGSIMMVAGSLGSGTITNAPNLIAHGAGSNPSQPITGLPTHTVTTVGSGTPLAGSITLYGADGVTVGGSLTTNGGYVRIWGDSDDAGGGGLTLSAPVTTNGGNLYLSTGSSNIIMSSSMTLGAGRIYFKADGTHTTGTKVLSGILNASGDVTLDTAFEMDAGASILTDGTITFSSTVALNTGSGALTLRATALDFSAATFTNLSTASMVLEPADPTTSMILGDTTGFASATTLAKLPGIKNLTIGRRDATGTVTLPASNFSFAANGTLELINKTVDISGGTLTNTAGNIILTGDNVNIAQNVTANGGTGSVTIRQMTAGSPINLGTGLTSSAVGHINAATLVVGRTDGGDLTFNNDITTTATNVHLLSGGRVIGDAGGVAATNLAITALGGTSLTSPTFNYTTLALDVGGTTNVSKGSDFTLGTIDGVSGLTIDTGTNAAVTFQTPGNFSSGTAPLTFNSNTGLVTFRASTVTLSGSTVSGNVNESFAVEPYDPTANIGIGGAFASATSLGKLTGSKNVTIGRADSTGVSTVSSALSLAESGTLTIDGAAVTVSSSLANTTGSVALAATQGNIALNSNVSANTNLILTDSSASSSIAGAGNLTAAGLKLVAANSDFSSTGTNSIGTLAGAANTVTFSQAGALSIGTVSGATGLNTSGDVFLRTTGATSDITLNGAINTASAGGDIVLAAGRNFINNVGSNALSALGTYTVYSGSPLLDTRGNLAYNYKQYGTSYGGTLLGSGNGFIYRTTPTVTVSLTGPVSKVYDGNATATLTGSNFSISGAIDGDSVGYLNNGATYNTKNVGTGKTVTANVALNGATNGAATVYGYALSSGTPSAAIGTITAAPLTVGTATVNNKVYNGNTNATVASVALTGVIGSDDVSTTSSGAFADKNVANGKSVTVTGVTLGGVDAGNYSLNTTSTTGAADITPATLTVGSATIAGKTYDAGTTASVTNVALTGIFGSDDVSATGTGAFNNKNVGTGKGVNVTALALSGADAGNYNLNTTSTTGTGNISAATLTVGNATVANKVYDGGTTATVSGVALTGVLGSDDVGTTATGVFADKNVGNSKGVAVSGVTLTGTDANNYTVNTTTTTGTADITPASLTISSTNIGTKVYDGGTTASVTGVSLAGILGSDDVSAVGSGTFDNKNVGATKNVSVYGVTISGNDANNYTLAATTASGIGSITPATLTVGTATVANKVYDGGTHATVSSVALTGVIGSDDVGTSATGAFADKNVANGKAVTVSAVTLTGGDANDYVINTSATTGTADITPATLTINSTTIGTKVYDGNTNASVTQVALGGIIGSDDVTAAGSGSFDNKNVSATKNVSVYGVALSGGDASNYVLASTTSSGLGAITPATVSIGTATIGTKVYDGSTHGTVDLINLSGQVSGDDVIASGTGTFSDKNVGPNKTVSVTGLSLSGGDAGNYVLNTTHTSGSGTITPATLTVSGATVGNKTYDGNTHATINGLALTGVVAGDTVSTTSRGTFSDKNVGLNKVVTIDGIALVGGDAGNYVLASTGFVGSASISPALLTLGAISIADKIYDGSTQATTSAIALNGIVAGDQIGTTSAARYTDKNAGNNKTVLVSAIALTGADAGNYTVSSTTASTTGDVSKATISVSGVDILPKSYDGTNSATITGIHLTGVVAGDDVSANGKATLADVVAGDNKVVNVNDISLSGADATNYALSADAFTTSATVKSTQVPPAVSSLTSPVVTTNGTVTTGTSNGSGGSNGDGGSGSAASTPLNGGNASHLGAGNGGTNDLYVNNTESGVSTNLVAGATSTNASSSDAANGASNGSASGNTGAGGSGLGSNDANGNGSNVGSNGSSNGFGSANGSGSGNASNPGNSGNGSSEGANGSGTNGSGNATSSFASNSILTNNGGASLAIDLAPASAPVSTTVAVYVAHDSETVQSQGQFIVTDRGNTLSLLPASGAETPTPSLHQSVTRSVQTNVPVDGDGLALLTIQLLADNTLIVTVPTAADHLSNETLTTYALAVAKQSFGLPVKGISSVVLQRSK